jgi:cold shock CspA family protein
LQQLAERKQASFIHSDIASAAWDTGDHGLTFRHALEAVLGPQEIGFKLQAVRLLGEALWERGDLDMARSHLRLCFAVRHASGWGTSQDLTALAKRWEVAEEHFDPHVMLKELLPTWRRWKDGLVPRNCGTVTKLLPNGHAGFIHGDDGMDYYFDMRDWRARNSKPTERMRVSFTTKSGFDKKRQRSTTVAAEIQPAATDGAAVQ